MVHPAPTEAPGVSALVRSGTPLGLFVALGLTAGAIGVAWPPMRATFGAPLAGLGLILAAVTVGYFTGSASSGPLGARISSGSLIVTGCGLAGTGLVGVSLASAWLVIPGLGLVSGLGFGLIDAAVNTQVSLTRGIRYMGWLHASWAAGAAIGPQVVVASLFLTGSWRPAFAFMGLTLLALGVAATFQERARTRPPVEPPTPAPHPSVSSYGRAIVLLAALLLLAAGLEATTGDWSYSQLTLGRGMRAALASLGATFFWAGLASGRVALGLLGNRVPAMALLDASMVLSAVATLAYWLSPPVVSAVIVLPLLGMAVSAFFPLLLSLTPSRVGTGMTGHAVGYALAAGTVGGGALPAATGLILQAAGLRALGPTMAVMAVGLLVLHAVSRRG